MANVGTLMSWDELLQTQATVESAGGEQVVYQYIANRIRVQNEQVADTMRSLVDTTDQAQLPAYGTTVGSMEMVELGETGTPFSQKIAFDSGNMGFPLQRFGILIQWDQDYLDNVTLAELGAQTDEALRADVERLWIQLRTAIFRATNYNFKDKLGKRLTYAVKAFANADGMSIPAGPNGRTFDGATHTHYLATAALVAGNVSALVDTVLEHSNTGTIYLDVNQTEYNLIRVMPNFTPYENTNIVQGNGSTAVFAAGNTLNLMDPYNREVGMWDGVAIVRVKPWMPASYMFCHNSGMRKPIAMRRPAKSWGSNFRLVAEYTNYPLHARRWQREFGFAVQGRVSGAILYTGGGTYVQPTIIGTI